jgi:DNA-binding NtrC family response regulator
VTVADTIDDSGTVKGPRERAVPGVIVVFSGHAPILRALPLKHGKLLLGREEVGLPDDERLSRRHAEIEWDGRRWLVRDLGSRNGTNVNGQRVEGTITSDELRVVRVGRTLMLPREDIRLFLGEQVVVEDELVIGPISRRIHMRIAQIASADENLLITGETGSGKEHAAHKFHARGPAAKGPLVTVNCATIPEGVAERLLFGAKKGAYSGAENADGYVVAAHNGVLFLDEIGELELDVQAKLLRLLETREITPLGATQSRKVALRFCFATHRDLRAAVADGRFREDLYHRIGQPHVHLPPLRDRREEIPWLLARAMQRVNSELTMHASFVEACLHRAWTGNVRELLQHARAAGHAAMAAGERSVVHTHLDSTAGIGVDDRKTDPGVESQKTVSREAVEQALKSEQGNIAAAARGLGLHRTQLYRMLKRFGIVPPREE